MKHFINLSSRVINKKYIIEIIKQTSKYYIYMTGNNRVSGNLYYGLKIENGNIIKVCEKNNKKDYEIIKKLIENENEEE